MSMPVHGVSPSGHGGWGSSESHAVSPATFRECAVEAPPGGIDRVGIHSEAVIAVHTGDISTPADTAVADVISDVDPHTPRNTSWTIRTRVHRRYPVEGSRLLLRGQLLLQ